jgi:hypothetical protein
LQEVESAEGGAQLAERRVDENLRVLLDEQHLFPKLVHHGVPAPFELAVKDVEGEVIQRFHQPLYLGEKLVDVL